ncbi:MAG: hypothetical protein QOJ03_1690 [Frankiaceae bacterium]|jgi:nucleoid-associated protein YgaU|nr:hypothetical protein [Frankiaceae bacterium]
MALPRSRAAAPSAVASANATAAIRRVTGTWSQPEPWTVAVLLVTGVVIIGRHPIAHMLGTEVNTPAAVPMPVATAPAVAGATQPAAPAAALAAAPTHAPRDPFHALVAAGPAVLTPDFSGRSTGTTAPAVHQPQTTPLSPAGTATCAGTTHTVVAGDTLWTIAATAVKSADDKRVTVAWHRIYRANRPPLSDPAMLTVGAKLCLPTSA